MCGCVQRLREVVGREERLMQEEERRLLQEEEQVHFGKQVQST
jgi:hypothetical protein